MASSEVKGYKEVPTLALISKIVWKVNSFVFSFFIDVNWATEKGPSEQPNVVRGCVCMSRFLGVT